MASTTVGGGGTGTSTSGGVADVGLIGLGVMGQNLALNMADHAFRVAVFNRTTEVTKAFAASHTDTPGGLVPATDLRQFVGSLRTPRIIVVLVKAGPAVDAVVEQLLAAGIQPPDLVVDAGNSLWTDTIRREKQYSARLKFFGSGVSGGEEGARFGPSLMPGGEAKSWDRLRPVWNAIAAKVDPTTGRPIEGAAPGRPVRGGEPCSAYIGPDGAGHFVKMVHNGIEYADMQLICEAYHLLRDCLGLKAPQIGDVFAEWNKGDLDSYLVEITADVLHQADPARPRRFLVDSILDAAGQKGTGKWTSTIALDLGVTAPTIAEAVFARSLSAAREERAAASRILRGPSPARKKSAARLPGGKAGAIDAIREALFCSKMCAYAQGFALMRAAQGEYHWSLDFGTIASIWRGGCIIRARFLQRITEAFRESPDSPNLMLAPYFRRALAHGQESWRRAVSLASAAGVPAPGFSSALAYYDGYRCDRLPANLLQAQRDYFGAHTYERIDKPRGKFFHTEWSSPDRREKPV